MYLDFFQGLPKKPRGDRVERRVGLSSRELAVLHEFGEEYFDGKTGYGGYYYDGRWAPVAEEMVAHYRLGPKSKVLEVGCAKGYLMYEMFKLGIQGVHGCDISEYAISHVPAEIRPNFRVMSADSLDYPDDEFDLVLTIDCFNNLDSDGVDRAIREVMRVSGNHMFIRLASYETEAQRENVTRWGVTGKTFESTTGWVERFERLGYPGDWHFLIFEELV